MTNCWQHIVLVIHICLVPWKYDIGHKYLISNCVAAYSHHLYFSVLVRSIQCTWMLAYMAHKHTHFFFSTCFLIKLRIIGCLCACFYFFKVTVLSRKADSRWNGALYLLVKGCDGSALYGLKYLPCFTHLCYWLHSVEVGLGEILLLIRWQAKPMHWQPHLWRAFNSLH